jgi:hypothetical protein
VPGRGRERENSMEIEEKRVPGDIDTGQHFFNAFGNLETEISARWIVQFCQERGQEWGPFTEEELELYYNQHGYEGFWFNGLLTDDQRYIRVDKEARTYEVTPEFIRRCYKAAPSAKVQG